MMDHERQERDLQEIFNTIRASYLAAIENTFALQERTLKFARHLMETSAEALEAPGCEQPCDARNADRRVQETSGGHGELA
jgi:hypothetical protein